MIKPYVYKLTHKKTNQFYFGFRCANKLNPEDDILIYQSSSNIIKNIGFENFNAEIIAVFFNKESAYDFEQYLIHESRFNPNILNKMGFYNKKRFINYGHSADTKHKMSKSRLGVKKSTEMIEKMRATKTGKSKLSGRSAQTDPVAIANIKRRIKNYEFNTLQELASHLKELSNSGMSNVKISQHLNISQNTVAKYKKMFAYL